MTRAYEKLLEYVKFDTASDAGSPTVPSTMKQKDLGEYLVKEMQAMGIKDAEMDENGYVYGSIPATPGYEKAPKIGFWLIWTPWPMCRPVRIPGSWKNTTAAMWCLTKSTMW